MIEVIHNVKLILIHLVKSLKAIEIFYCQFTVIVPAWKKFENRYLVVASSSSSFCHSQVKNMVQEYIVYKFCQCQNEETKLNWLWELLMGRYRMLPPTERSLFYVSFTFYAFVRVYGIMYAGSPCQIEAIARFLIFQE